MSRYYIVTGPFLTEWTHDEISRLAYTGSVVLCSVSDSGNGKSYFYRRTPMVRLAG